MAVDGVVPLTQGYVAKVDVDDLNSINKSFWTLKRCRSGKLYAQKSRKDENGIWSTTTMHSEIMQTPAGSEVDHIDGDGLNNTKTNLRIVSHKQNQQNIRPRVGVSSKYKGVSWHNQAQKWRAYLRGRHLGLFEDETSAAIKYDREALKLFGQFAKLNFPRKNYL